MEDILNLIIESDEKAREITQKAAKDKENKKREIINEREKIYKEYIDLAKARIDRDVENTKVRQKARLDEAVKANSIIKDEMEKHFSSNREKWVDEIFSSVIKG